MKDALGHGSDGKGLHSQGVESVGRTRVFHGTAGASGVPHSPFFTSNLGDARNYAKTRSEVTGEPARVLEAEFAPRNPKILDDDTMEWIGYEKAQLDKYRAMGHDALMRADKREIIALDPRSIRVKTK
jgi:hypothetical protein